MLYSEIHVQIPCPAVDEIIDVKFSDNRLTEVLSLVTEKELQQDTIGKFIIYGQF